MNLEQIEAELLSLKGKPVIITVPFHGSSSLSLAGELEVKQNTEFKCVFHISAPMGSWAYVFSAESVKSLQPSVSTEFVKVINIKKNSETA